MLAAAGVALAVPTSGFAIDSVSIGESAGTTERFIPFTPAKVDPSLLREVASTLGTDALRFTPAARPARAERTVTMAVRVDDATARAISVRNAIGAQDAQPGLGTGVAIAPTRYNLGIARGYQGFAQPAPKAIDLPSGIRNIAMPDLSEFSTSTEREDDEPSRFQPRIALEKDGDTGRAPRTLEGSGVQTVDVGGSYRVVGNLNVTAGVRLSQERDRIAPLTDGVEDSQAVYVGTQFKF